MSLILEALQRADEERKQADEIPGLDARHAVDNINAPEETKPDPSTHSRGLLLSLLGIIALLIGYLIFLQLQQSAPDRATDTTAERTDKVSGPANTQNTAITKSAPTPEIIPEIMPARPGSSLGARPQASQGTETRRSTASAEALNKLYEQAKRESNAPPVSKSTPTPGLTEALRATTREDEVTTTDDANNTEDPYAFIPFINQLPGAQQSRVPAIRYTTHGYSRETKSGEVTLNGRKRRRGDTVEPGLVLLEITEDYIVLDMEGTVFRLEAATDWGG